MSRIFLISTIVMLAVVTAEELEILRNYHKSILSSSGMLRSNDNVSTVENGDNTGAIVVAISCFVLFGILMFIFYRGKHKKKETTKSEEASQPLVTEELNVNLNFDLYKD